MDQSEENIIPSITITKASYHRKNGSNVTTYNTIMADDDETAAAVTPLPKIQMLVICIVLFSEPLTSTVLFPFIYFMLKDFHLSDDEKEIGAYAGWITSIFFIAQFCTSLKWGKLSDKIGRRPVLLIGLVGNAVSSCLFGLSKNLWWAIGSRALCGIMNGNVGVARSMVSEITDNTNKAKAFSVFGFFWSTGMIVGPALGGYLNKPAEQFPNVFGNCQFLKDYPYFLPCFVSALGSMIGFVIGYLFLKESNPHIINKNTLQESTPLLANKSKPNEPTLRQVTSASIQTILSFSIASLHAMMFDEVLPLYFTAPVQAGGLGITSADFAKTLSFFGIIQILIQFKVYPTLARLHSTLTLARFSFLLIVPVYFVFPELTTLREWINDGSQNWTFRSWFLCLLFVRYFTVCLAFTSLAIMVSTSAVPEVLGLVNGLCQSCLSLVRAMGPTLGGTLWSLSIKDGNPYPFDRHLLYYLIAILSVLGFVQSYWIPNRVALGRRTKLR